ncbi:type II toxin-antitoxin system RelE/ParE family toxin [Singulisphaera sp. Ch08]|uniref:Type II toxin-antitoxin system RelE/ParE family toxin n=1 Tax=Singulisphaera sp. Ch08 TaxID=3120278 RepID=A0AAU7C8X2_9BACT
MSNLAYTLLVSTANEEPKPLAWLHGEIKTPPFSEAARIEAGLLLRRIQNREIFGMPHSRPMPSIGARCHELRIKDENRSWRIVYRIDADAIVIVDVFAKITQQTPKVAIDRCKSRLARYDEAS